MNSKFHSVDFSFSLHVLEVDDSAFLHKNLFLGWIPDLRLISIAELPTDTTLIGKELIDIIYDIVKQTCSNFIFSHHGALTMSTRDKPDLGKFIDNFYSDGIIRQRLASTIAKDITRSLPPLTNHIDKSSFSLLNDALVLDNLKPIMFRQINLQQSKSYGFMIQVSLTGLKLRSTDNFKDLI